MKPEGTVAVPGYAAMWPLRHLRAVSPHVFSSGEDVGFWLFFQFVRPEPGEKSGE
jgi:hypothetical protein